MHVKRIIVRNQYCEGHKIKALHFCWCPMYHTRSPPPDDAACRRSAHKFSPLPYDVIMTVPKQTKRRCNIQHSERTDNTINNRVAKPRLRNRRLLCFQTQNSRTHWNTLYKTRHQRKKTRKQRSKIAKPEWYNNAYTNRKFNMWAEKTREHISWRR